MIRSYVKFKNTLFELIRVIKKWYLFNIKFLNVVFSRLAPISDMLGIINIVYLPNISVTDFIKISDICLSQGLTWYSFISAPNQWNLSSRLHPIELILVSILPAESKHAFPWWCANCICFHVRLIGSFTIHLLVLRSHLKLFPLLSLFSSRWYWPGLEVFRVSGHTFKGSFPPSLQRAPGLHCPRSELLTVTQTDSVWMNWKY